MKVLHLLSWYNAHPGSHDGILFRDIASALRRRGVETELLVVNLDARQPLSKFRYGFSRLTRSCESGVPVFRYNGWFLPKKYPWILWLWSHWYLGIFKRYLNCSNRPDLLHAHGIWAGYMAMQIENRYGIPYVYTEHTRLPSEAWKKELMTAILHRSGAVSAVSEKLGSDLRHLFSVGISVIPNFMDTGLFRPLPCRQRPKDKPITFLAVGSPAGIKGFDLLITAFYHVVAGGRTHIRLQLADTVRGARRLKRQAARLGILQKVEFLGSMSREVLARIMQQADVFVSSSRFESFGLVILEAMSTGLPVIATATYGPSAYLLPEQGVLVSCNNTEALAQAIQEMCDGYCTYAPEQIRASVVERFSEEGVMRAYSGMYEQVLGQPKP